MSIEIDNTNFSERTIHEIVTPLVINQPVELSIRSFGSIIITRARDGFFHVYLHSLTENNREDKLQKYVLAVMDEPEGNRLAINGFPHTGLKVSQFQSDNINVIRRFIQRLLPESQEGGKRSSKYKKSKKSNKKSKKSNKRSKNLL